MFESASAMAYDVDVAPSMHLHPCQVNYRHTLPHTTVYLCGLLHTHTMGRASTVSTTAFADADRIQASTAAIKQ